MNIEVCNAHDLVEMFGKHKAYRCCLLTLSYQNPSVEPPKIPGWDFSTSIPSIQPPMTPSVGCPILAEPTHDTHTHTQPEEPELLANPNPMNEFVGIDEEGLYIDLGPKHPLPPPNSHYQGGSRQIQDESCGAETCFESMSDDDTEVEDIDDIVKDREPEQMSDVDYDMKDSPMTVRTMYSNMDAFKIALNSHAVKNEFNYDIENSDPGRYRANCAF
jgi:hypothetical protein